MSISRRLSALMIAGLLFLIGCSQTRVYRVTVRNATSAPICIGFTKDGPPHEPGWVSPEELTDVPPSRRPLNWGQVVDPAHKASAKVQGLFASGTHAFLRVYLGAPTNDDLLAMSHGNGMRTDVLLLPETVNDFTVTENEGRVSAHLTHR